jgi:rare lipoprotein A
MPKQRAVYRTCFFFLAGLFFLLTTACLPKRSLHYERKDRPPDTRELKAEPVPEEKIRPGRIETGKVETGKVETVRIEKRETRGVQYGVASWYGPDFHGKPTSSGEIYDMYQLTCAHNTLALGTTVIVTNLENGKSLDLRVNDRGPFVKDRIIDLSYSAARMLGVYEKGTAFVKVETVGPWVEESQRITLQVGSFSDEARARRLAETLSRHFEGVHVTPVETSLQTYYRVRIGPFESRESALTQAEQVSRMGYQVLLTNR